MIPISQNLQLASQSNVTPWELPYEELFAGLANKQKTFDDRVESIGALNELFPEGGIFTKDAANKFKEDYMGRVLEIEESLHNEGKVDPLSIKKLARDITTDDRMVMFKHDRENLTNWYLEAKVSGELISGVNNMTNPTTGEPVQVSSMEEMANLQHIPNQDYNLKFNEKVSKYIQPFKSALETSGAIYDSKTGTYKVSEDYEKDGIKWTKGDVLETKDLLQMFDKVVNGKVVKDNEGNAYQGSSFVDNLMAGSDLDIIFFKELYKQKHGLQTEEELKRAYIEDVVLPNLEIQTYKHTKVVRKVDIERKAAESVNNQGSGDEVVDPNLNTKELTYAMKVGQEVLKIMGIEEDQVDKVNLATLSNSIDEVEAGFSEGVEERKTIATNMNITLLQQESSSLQDLMSSFNIPQENVSPILGEWFNLTSDSLGNLKVNYNQSTLEKATSTLTTPDKLKLYKEVERLKNNIEVRSEDYGLNSNIIDLNKGMYSSLEQVNTLKNFREVMLESSSAVEKVNTLEKDLEKEYYTKKTDYKQTNNNKVFTEGLGGLDEVINAGIDLRTLNESDHIVLNKKTGSYEVLGKDFSNQVDELKRNLQEQFQNRSSEIWSEDNAWDVIHKTLKEILPIPDSFSPDKSPLSIVSRVAKQLFLEGQEYFSTNNLEKEIAEEMGYVYGNKVEDLKGVVEKEKRAAVSDKLEQELNPGQKDKIENIIQNALTKKVMLTAGYAFDLMNIDTHFKATDLNVRQRVVDNMVNSITTNYSVVGQEGKLTLTQLGEELSENQLKYYNEFVGGVEVTSKETDGNIQIISKINANSNKPYNIKPIYYRDDSSGDWYLAIHVPGISEKKPQILKGKEYLQRNSASDLVSIKLEKKEQEYLEKNLKFNFKGDSEEVVIDNKRTKMLGNFNKQGYTKTDLFRDDNDPNNDVKATYTYDKIGNNVQSTLYLGDTKIGVPINFIDVKGAATLEYHLQDLSDNIEDYRELVPAEEFKNSLLNKLDLFLETEGNSYNLLDGDLTKIINHIYQRGFEEEDLNEKK